MKVSSKFRPATARNLFFTLLSFSGLVANCQTNTWIAPGPGAGNWNTASNWSLGTVPDSDDDVIFSNAVPCNIDVNAVARTITLSNSFSSTVTQQGSNTITLVRATAGSTTEGVMTVQGGAFVGGSGNISVQGFVMSGGDFTSSSGALTIGGNLAAPTVTTVSLIDITGGTFVHNSGSMVFTFSNVGSATAFEINTISTTEFFNVQFNALNNRTISSPTGDVIISRGSMSLTDGKVNTANLEAYGNVTVSSTFDGGNAALRFAGSGDQIFDLTGAADVFDGNVTIDKTSAASKVTLASALTLDKNGQILTLTTGTLVTSSTNLLYVDGVSVSGGSTTSFVDGPMKKSGNSAFTFPVGKNGSYAPIGVSSTSTSVTTEYFQVDPATAIDPDLAAGSNLDHLSRVEYWTLTKEGGSKPSVTLSWQSTRSGTIDDLSALVVASYNGTAWTNQGATSLAGNTSAGTITSSATNNDFIAYTIASTSVLNPLPVSLVDFDVKKINSHMAEVTWSTAQEVNSNYFTIERSEDGENFAEVAKIPSKGNSNSPSSYYFLDRMVPCGYVFYRLSQTDFDKSTYALKLLSAKLVECSAQDVQIVVFPNPASDILNVLVPLDDSFGTPQIVLVNAAGQYIMSPLVTTQQFEIDLNAIPSGFYMIIAKVGDKILACKKLVVAK